MGPHAACKGGRTGAPRAKTQSPPAIGQSQSGALKNGLFLARLAGVVLRAISDGLFCVVALWRALCDAGGHGGGHGGGQGATQKARAMAGRITKQKARAGRA